LAFDAVADFLGAARPFRRRPDGPNGTAVTGWWDPLRLSAAIEDVRYVADEIQARWGIAELPTGAWAVLSHGGPVACSGGTIEVPPGGPSPVPGTFVDVLVAAANVMAEAQPSRESKTRPPVRRPNEARDKWIYEQCVN
jgi:hypothetical protein